MGAGKLVDEAVIGGAHIVFVIDFDQLFHKFTNDVQNCLVHFLFCQHIHVFGRNSFDLLPHLHMQPLRLLSPTLAPW